MNPRAMTSDNGSSAVVVDRRGLKPCCESAKVRCSLKYGKISLSRTFASGDSKEMGLYDDPSVTGLPGLGMAIMLAVFQAAGMEAVERERLKIWVR